MGILTMEFCSQEERIYNDSMQITQIFAFLNGYDNDYHTGVTMQDDMFAYWER